MWPKDDGFARAKVNSRKRNSDGNLIWACSSNPFLDTHFYEVEFQDGTANEYATNIIADTWYSQTCPDSNEFLIFKYIIDHRYTDKAVPLSDAYECDTKRNKYKKMTAGCELMLEWAEKTQPQTRIDLKALK